MRRLQLISYNLTVTVCYRYLPPPNRERITAGSPGQYLNLARGCRARSMAGAGISGAPYSAGMPMAKPGVPCQSTGCGSAVWLPVWLPNGRKRAGAGRFVEGGRR